MTIHTILLPYDSGHRDARMGRGPLHLRERGAIDRLRAAGHDVIESLVEAPDAFPTEIGTSFALYRVLAEDVRATVTGGAFPLTLAGNCGSALGTVSGVRAATPNDRSDVGVIWLDAHADFNTPETTATGFLDGTALAALAGHCWHTLTASIPGFRPVTDAHVDRIEAAVDRFNSDLAPLKDFILPGGSRAAALAHVVRTVCRRAERAVVTLAGSEEVGEPSRKYLNRLSDLMFVLSRALNRVAGRPDVLWRRDREKGAGAEGGS